MSGRRPLSLRVYALATAAAAPLAPRFLSGRVKRGKEDPARLGERLGRAGLPRPAGRLVWMHGASVGEGLSLLPLVARLQELRPEVSILITTGTRASAEVLAQRLPPGTLHQFAPIDTPAAARRFIDHWRPDLGLFVESELWPNLIWAAHRSGARLALVSAKMSARSLRTWGRLPGAARAMLGAFDLILARDRDAGARFETLGGAVAGVWDAKLGAAPLPVDEAELRRLRDHLAERPVILAASTHPGEDVIIASSFAGVAKDGSEPLLIVVPRHAARGLEVERTMREHGLTTVRRADGDPLANVQVLIADTLGELGLWYRLARLAIVGGSLVDGVGGHNPLEPARLGCPFVAGTHVTHWPIYGDLARAEAAALVAGGDDLAAWFCRALADPTALRAMAARAAAYAARRDEEGQTVVPRLLSLIGP